MRREPGGSLRADDPELRWAYTFAWRHSVCGICARADWTVEGCDATTCDVRLDTHANAWALHPGILHMWTTTVPGDGGDCVGSTAAADTLGATCDRVCETAATPPRQIRWRTE